MSDFAENIIVFTDGACSGNPGPGGWGAILAYPEGLVKELGGKASSTTNNRMELQAAIEALRELKAHPSKPVEFYTDSVYVIRGITQWIWGWLRRHWKNGEGEEVSNRDQWEILLRLVQDRKSQGKINWHFSRGHVGIPGNERCDEIAVNFSKGKWVDLYEGALLSYQVPIHDLPEDTGLPEMKPKKEKKAAYSYLSYVGGEVWRHSDWGSCERRVKGQSGAKFKKAMSSDDERQIIESWGLGANVKVHE